jgi:hypothetical protein
VFAKLAATLSVSAIAVLTATSAQATDACHGYDVACDADGCLVCWTAGDGDLACEEVSHAEILVTLPGCVDSGQELGLVAPQGPRLPELVGTGGRTVLPEAPMPERLPTITPNG